MKTDYPRKLEVTIKASAHSQWIVDILARAMQAWGWSVLSSSATGFKAVYR